MFVSDLDKGNCTKKEQITLFSKSTSIYIYFSDICVYIICIFFSKKLNMIIVGLLLAACFIAAQDGNVALQNVDLKQNVFLVNHVHNIYKYCPCFTMYTLCLIIYTVWIQTKLRMLVNGVDLICNIPHLTFFNVVFFRT